MSDYTPPDWVRTTITVGEWMRMRAVADAYRVARALDPRVDPFARIAADERTDAALAELDRYTAAAAAEGETSGGCW